MMPSLPRRAAPRRAGPLLIILENLAHRSLFCSAWPQPAPLPPLANHSLRSSGSRLFRVTQAPQLWSNGDGPGAVSEPRHTQLLAARLCES